MTHPDAEHAHWWWRDASAGPTVGPAVIVDVDGVIADGWHRQHHLDGERRDWRSFFDAAAADPPIDSMILVLEQLSTDVVIVLVTARPHGITRITLDWLVEHDVRWDLLVIRSKELGGVSSPIFKRRALDQLRARGLEPVVAFDDDMRNVEMYQDEDVPIVYIHSGYYD